MGTSPDETFAFWCTLGWHFTANLPCKSNLLPAFTTTSPSPPQTDFRSQKLFLVRWWWWLRETFKYFLRTASACLHLAFVTLVWSRAAGKMISPEDSPEFSDVHVQSASIAQSQCLVKRLCGSSSYNDILFGLHSNCSMAQRPGELPQ